MEYGKERGNPEATLTNSTRFPKCPSAEVATDSLEVTSLVGSELVTNFEFNGTNYALSIRVDAADDLQEAILAIVSPFEIDPYVSVTFGTGTLNIEHRGALALSEATVDGSEEAFTRA